LTDICYALLFPAGQTQPGLQNIFGTDPLGDLPPEEGCKLNQLQMFVIRAVIGLFVAVVITRIFTGRIDIPYILGLAIIMVGLAYFSEYLRQRRNK
jgi:hypothetical protein